MLGSTSGTNSSPEKSAVPPARLLRWILAILLTASVILVLQYYLCPVLPTLYFQRQDSKVFSKVLAVMQPWKEAVLPRKVTAVKTSTAVTSVRTAAQIIHPDDTGTVGKSTAEAHPMIFKKAILKDSPERKVKGEGLNEWLLTVVSTTNSPLPGAENAVPVEQEAFNKPGIPKLTKENTHVLTNMTDSRPQKATRNHRKGVIQRPLTKSEIREIFNSSKLLKQINRSKIKSIKRKLPKIPSHNQRKSIRKSGLKISNPKSPSKNVAIKSRHNTTILLWYWPFQESSSLEGNPCLEHYGIPNCVLVTNQSWYLQADLVVFHNRELISGKESLPLHLPRPKTPKWVWLSMESPQNNGNMSGLAGQFNYTMSYRRDSDIYTPYGHLIPHKMPAGTRVEDLIPNNKTGVACWVVSNYNEMQERSVMINELQKTIPVHVYGSALNPLLSAKDLLPTISRYYFYLSFENSIAPDYITEKVWRNAFMSGTVPVVLGPSRDQYEATLPLNSFIHVDDFSSMEELGQFLRNLSKDPDTYASYFAWRLNYTVTAFTGDWRHELCRICPHVNKLPAQKVYEDLEAWDRQQNGSPSL